MAERNVEAAVAYLEKTFRFVLTFYRQVTDTLPTVSRLLADCRLTVGRQSADSRPTGFLGSSSSQLPIFAWVIIHVLATYS